MRVIWLRQRDGSDWPYEVIKETAITRWTKKDPDGNIVECAPYGYTALRVHRIMREAVEYPMMDNDPRLIFDEKKKPPASTT